MSPSLTKHMGANLRGGHSPGQHSWDSGLGPEETGRRDGEGGHPAQHETHSEFEQQVRERLEAHIEGLKSAHAEAEARLAAQYRDLLPRFSTAREAYEQKRAALGNRDIDAPVPHLLAIWVSLVLVAMSGVLNTYEFAHAGWDFGLAVLFGLIMALLVGLGSYLSGMMFRQAKSRFGHVLALGIMVSALLSAIFVVMAFDKTELGLAIRLALVSLEFIAMLLICALAYYSHDPDLAYPPLCRKHEKLLNEISRVTSMRNGGRAQSVNGATACRDRAQELVRVYRHHNKLARKNAAPPEFFELEPDFKEICEDDFPLQCENSPDPGA